MSRVKYIQNILKFNKNHLSKAANILGLLLVFLVGFSTGIFTQAKNVYAYDEVVVVIDPGHGGPSSDTEDETNSGAKYNGLMEKDINLTTARALKKELEQYGNVAVYLTRDEDVEMTLEERVAFAVSKNADMLISIHYNASLEHNLFGAEVFTSAFGECYSKGHSLATCIMKEWEDNGSTLKDIKTRIGNSGNDYYGLIRHGTSSGLPTIICEHGYIDNDKDFPKMDDNTWEIMGRNDAKAIATYYGLERDVVKEKVGPTVTTPLPEGVVEPDSTEPVGVRLSVDKYDFETGEVEFTLNAIDDESKLMFYGFKTGDVHQDTVFPDLELWTGKNGTMKGTYKVEPEYEGALTAAVFNSFNLDTKSNSVDLDRKMSGDDVAEEDNITDDADILSKEDSKEEASAEEKIETDESLQIYEFDEDNNTQLPLEENGNNDFVINGNNDRETVPDSDMIKAIENEPTTVEESFKKLFIVGLVAAVVVAVSIVLLIVGAVNKAQNRRRRRQNQERKRYDWERYD